MNFVYTDDLDSISILLVEDEALVAIDVKAIIEMAGGRVVGPAYSLGQGFSWMDRGRIDCAVLDVRLHNESVFALADALVDRGIPIIFLSAHSLAAAPPRHRECCLVRKPFHTARLIQSIRTAVARHRAPAHQI
jgi:DNA-binding response OmpR family regulator